MAKKKAKVSKKSLSAKKSHGELFDKHDNLIWLLPIFFIVAIIAVMALNNSTQPVDQDLNYENEVVIDNNIELPETEELMVEEDL